MFRVILFPRDFTEQTTASYYDTAEDAYKSMKPGDLSRVHLKLYYRVLEELAAAAGPHPAVLIWFDDERAAFLQKVETGREALPDVEMPWK